MPTKLLDDRVPTPMVPVVMLPPAPRSEWMVLVIRNSSALLWHGSKRDLPVAWQAGKVVALSMQNFVRKHEPRYLYDSNGGSVWAFGPLVGANYFVDKDGAVWWWDTEEPPPALPPPRKLRREIKMPAPEPEWKQQARRCLKHATHPRDIEFLNNIQGFRELSPRQIKWLDDITARIDDAPRWRTQLEAMRQRRKTPWRRLNVS